MRERDAENFNIHIGMHAIDHAIGQCSEQCHMNAQCTESGEGMAMCVCLPGFTGDGLNCSGQF